MSVKLKWKVGEAPTGRYKSFHHRGWPTAYYVGPKQKSALMISCEDSYSPFHAKSGQHSELKVSIANHNPPPEKQAGAFVWATLVKRFATLAEAKVAGEAFIANHPEFHPKEL